MFQVSHTSCEYDLTFWEHLALLRWAPCAICKSSGDPGWCVVLHKMFTNVVLYCSVWLDSAIAWDWDVMNVYVVREHVSQILVSLELWSLWPGAYARCNVAALRTLNYGSLHPRTIQPWGFAWIFLWWSLKLSHKGAVDRWSFGFEGKSAGTLVFVVLGSRGTRRSSPLQLRRKIISTATIASAAILYQHRRQQNRTVTSPTKPHRNIGYISAKTKPQK